MKSTKKTDHAAMRAKILAAMKSGTENRVNVGIVCHQHNKVQRRIFLDVLAELVREGTVSELRNGRSTFLRMNGAEQAKAAKQQLLFDSTEDGVVVPARLKSRIISCLSRSGGSTPLGKLGAALNVGGDLLRKALSSLQRDGRVVVAKSTLRNASASVIRVSHPIMVTLTTPVVQKPTAMTHLEFMRRFDDIRARVGVLGIIEMQGLTGIVLDEDIELDRNSNPSLAHAIEIALILHRERMVRVLPYQIRAAVNLQTELEELQSMPMFSTRSPTAAYARLSSLGYEATSLADVRRAMGHPEQESFCVEY